MDLAEYKILKNDNYSYRDLKPKIDGETLVGYHSTFDEEAIKNSLKNIFLVQKGEMPGNPQFGNPLRLSLFDNFDFFTESTLKTAIRVEIEKYEPRVTLLDVKIDLMQEYNRVLVEVIYTINLNNGITQDSLILPFSANDMTYLSGRTTSTI